MLSLFECNGKRCFMIITTEVLFVFLDCLSSLARIVSQILKRFLYTWISRRIHYEYMTLIQGLHQVRPFFYSWFYCSFSSRQCQYLFPGWWSVAKFIILFLGDKVDHCIGLSCRTGPPAYVAWWAVRQSYVIVNFIPPVRDYELGPRSVWVLSEIKNSTF